MFTILLTIFFLPILLFLAIKIVHILNTKGSTLKAMTLVMFFAVLFTISSISWTKDTAYDTETIKHLEFGWPVPFEMQNQERFDPPFPFLMGSAREVPSDFLWKNFFGSIFINTVLWGVGLFSLAFFFLKAGIVLRPPTLKVIFITIVTLIVAMMSLVFVTFKIYTWKNPGIDSPISRPSENTHETFEEVLNKEPAKEVSVTAVFTRSISLKEAKSAVKDIPFVVKGIRFNAGESNGGCGVEDGQTIIQALDNCVSENSLFLQRRIDMEKNTLSTVTDPGLQKAFVAHIAEAEKAQNIQFTAFELYGKAVDIQHFKENNIFIEKIEIMSQGTSSPSIQSGMQTPVMFPPSFSVPSPSPAR